MFIFPPKGALWAKKTTKKPQKNTPKGGPSGKKTISNSKTLNNFRQDPFLTIF